MRTLPITTPIRSVRTQAVFTQSRLKAQPLTQALASKLTPILGECDTAELKERELEDAQAQADAQVEYLNVEIDIHHALILAAVLAFEGNKSNSPLLKNLTQNQKPSDQRKPVLGPQLDEMRVWPETLAKVDDAGIQAKGSALAALIPLCDTAEQTKALCDQRLQDFVLVGEKKNLIDNTNALRKALWAELEQIRLANPQMHLPADWADSFFMQEAKPRGHTLNSVGEALARVEKEKARLLGIQAKLQQAQVEKQKAKAQAEAQEAQEELAELAKMKEEIAKREAELAAKLPK